MDGGKEQACVWVKDKFGVSWQVVPAERNTIMRTADKEQLESLTKAILKMGKPDIRKLRQIFNPQVLRS